jgi:hypothetical protein
MENIGATDVTLDESDLVRVKEVLPNGTFGDFHKSMRHSGSD